MAHELTFSFAKKGGDGEVTVNGVIVSSPYVLQNGDVIKIKTINGDPFGMYINGKSVGSSQASTFDMSDTDIDYHEDNVVGPSAGYTYITINYTESLPKGRVGKTNAIIKLTLPEYSGALRFKAAPQAELEGNTITLKEVPGVTSYDVYADETLIGTIEQ